MDGDVEFGEDFIGGSDGEVAVIFAKPIADDIHFLDDGDVEVESGGGEACEFSEGGDNTGVHRLDEAKHFDMIFNLNIC